MAVVKSVLFVLALMCSGVVDPMEQRGITTFHSMYDEALVNLVQEVTSLRAELEASKKRTTTAGKGSTYVRWGRTQCPPNSQLVYSGRAGGSYRENVGGSPNRLCLPMNPVYDSTAKPKTYGRLYGAKYLQVDGHQNHLTPCAVCHVTHGSTLMIPATVTCPPGWTVQYSGHLASEDYDHVSIAEYVCLDGHPEDVPNVHYKYWDGSFFYYTVGICGTLPCPPYEHDKVITCVVCSK